MEITQEQKYEILRNEIQKGMGLDQIVKLGLEILMNTEREEHNRQTDDYSNGYRYWKMYGCGAPSAKQRGNECRGIQLPCNHLPI